MRRQDRKWVGNGSSATILSHLLVGNVMRFVRPISNFAVPFVIPKYDFSIFSCIHTYKEDGMLLLIFVNFCACQGNRLPFPYV